MPRAVYPTPPSCGADPFGSGRVVIVRPGAVPNLTAPRVAVVEQAWGVGNAFLDVRLVDPAPRVPRQFIVTRDEVEEAE